MPQSRRMRRDEYHGYHDRVNKHYGGTHHGQSAAGIIYILATVLERVDNDLLWCVQPDLHNPSLNPELL